jgi:hypothetical protein
VDNSLFIDIVDDEFAILLCWKSTGSYNYFVNNSGIIVSPGVVIYKQDDEFRYVDENNDVSMKIAFTNELYELLREISKKGTWFGSEEIVFNF